MIVPPPEVIETPRLRLEPLVLCHARELEAFARLWQVARYTALIPHPYPPGGAMAFVEEVLARRRAGAGHTFAAVVPTDGTVIGCVNLDLSDDRRGAELGYIFAPWTWGRGFATESARVLVDAGFRRLGLDVVDAHAAVENQASCRVLARAGLRRIGNGSYWAPARGRRFISELYRLSRKEWMA